jgi:hypothetical protein
VISVRGTFHNGIAEPVEAVEGRDGQPVLITFLEDQEVGELPSAVVDDEDTLGKLIDACAVDTGIPDLALEHDHYIYGTPKKHQSSS